MAVARYLGHSMPSCQIVACALEYFGMVAQMEERRSEKPEVASSKLALPTRIVGL